MSEDPVVDPKVVPPGLQDMVEAPPELLAKPSRAGRAEESVPSEVPSHAAPDESPVGMAPGQEAPAQPIGDTPMSGTTVEVPAPAKEPEPEPPSASAASEGDPKISPAYGDATAATLPPPQPDVPPAPAEVKKPAETPVAPTPKGARDRGRVPLDSSPTEPIAESKPGLLKAPDTAPVEDSTKPTGVDPVAESKPKSPDSKPESPAPATPKSAEPAQPVPAPAKPASAAKPAGGKPTTASPPSVPAPAAARPSSPPKAPTPKPISPVATAPPLTPLHLALSFLSGLLLILSLCCLGTTLYATMRADPVTVPFSQVARHAGERVLLVGCTVATVQSSHPYTPADAELVTLKDTDGHTLPLLNTTHLSLPQGTSPYGLSVHCQMVGGSVVLSGPYLTEIDPIEFAKAGAWFLIPGLACVMLLIQARRAPRPSP